MGLFLVVLLAWLFTFRARYLILAALLFWGATTFAHAHTQWTNGDPIPDWIKAACCGPADAHLLRPDQVTITDDYYYVEGYHGRIPRASALPSQDGHYWGFWREMAATPMSAATQSTMYCFFVPMDF
jgi:hypothetical protein